MEKVKVVSSRHRVNVSRNVVKNREIVDYYYRMGVEAAVLKTPKDKRVLLRNKIKRMESCNVFWEMETYEASKVKLLLRTFLCHDKFCANCKRVKQFIMWKRFAPHMGKYRDSLYHIVLTVPDCSSEKLSETIKHMAVCFKTLTRYLRGEKPLKGIDFTKYGYQGCIRTLEVTYRGNIYHPHFHVAVVFDNPAVVADKNINNKFSRNEDRLFSEFEAMPQRIWWLLINKERLTYAAITAESTEHDRYSCIADKFQPEDYSGLFSYMTKIRSDENEFMEYENFKTLYHALKPCPTNSRLWNFLQPERRPRIYGTGIL